MYILDIHYLGKKKKRVHFDIDEDDDTEDEDSDASTPLVNLVQAAGAAAQTAMEAAARTTRSGASEVRHMPKQYAFSNTPPNPKGRLNTSDNSGSSSSSSSSPSPRFSPDPSPPNPELERLLAESKAMKEQLAALTAILARQNPTNVTPVVQSPHRCSLQPPPGPQMSLFR